MHEPHGRGAAENPPGRFERIAVEPDPESADPDEAISPRTQFLKDTSRTIIAVNESPDVGFEASVNPYRGCEQGCVYCLSGDTPILMANGSTKRIEEVREGDLVYGTLRSGHYRRYVRTRVRAHWEVSKPAYRITLGDGTRLVAGSDHRFLTERGWKFVTGTEQGRARRPHLTTSNKLMGTGGFATEPTVDREYERGYLCGLIRGDGHLKAYYYARKGRVHGNQYRFRLAMADGEALRRARTCLRHVGIDTHEFTFQRAVKGRRAIQAIRTSARAHVESLKRLIDWPLRLSSQWRKGFLSGLFDAEGSYSGGVLGMFNTDKAILGQVRKSLKHFKFDFSVSSKPGWNKRVTTIRLRGGLKEALRFFHTMEPAISRKRDIGGQALKSSADLRVIRIEPMRKAVRLYDLTTGTGDFIADGVLSHNCYARPTHEYLGFSPGLDFETRILVKERAPELLREALSSPQWVPKVIAISGVTDGYQPVEKRLGLTRRCLEVLAEFGNPVGIVTKSFLVTRDVDVLARLAERQAAAVWISITTLDGELAREMEPRASAPARRLEAVRRLTAAGIPVGVMVAPCIPGLTDHEMPAILEAAAQAGARHAGMTPVRLPLGVADLFAAWLERRFPQRASKVLGRIRQIRGGALNDPRFGSRMEGEGPLAEQMRALFRTGCRRAGLSEGGLELSTAGFRRPDGQLRLDFNP